MIYLNSVTAKIEKEHDLEKCQHFNAKQKIIHKMPTYRPAKRLWVTDAVQTTVSRINKAFICTGIPKAKACL